MVRLIHGFINESLGFKFVQLLVLGFNGYDPQSLGI